MKKMMVIVTLIGLFVCGSYYERYYTKDNCEVIDIVDGTAYIEDCCGFCWKYEATDLAVGDVVDLKMDNYGTVSCIDDDVIKKVVRK